MNTHEARLAAWPNEATFRQAYAALEAPFALCDRLLQARYAAGLTQAEVAERMGTKTSAVARREAGGGRQQHSPALATLRQYAAAVGCRVEITLVPVAPAPRREPAQPRRASPRAQPNPGLPPTRHQPRAADA